MPQLFSGNGRVCAFCVAAVGILLSWSTALHCCGKACASRNGALFCRRAAIPFQWGRDVCWMSFRGGCAVQKQAVSPTRSACSWVILWKMSPGFIAAGGAEYRCSGCWKVYGDVEQAQHLFRRYAACRKRYLAMASSGLTLGEMLAAG